MSEPFNLLVQAIGVESFDRLHDPGVERPAAIADEAAVCHLMCQRMLEGVLEVGKDLDLVQKLGGLELREATS